VWVGQVDARKMFILHPTALHPTGDALIHALRFIVNHEERGREIKPSKMVGPVQQGKYSAP
jgi:hypothetical protein